jgi:hypothetical protein
LALASVAVPKSIQFDHSSGENAEISASWTETRTGNEEVRDPATPLFSC